MSVLDRIGHNVQESILNLQQLHDTMSNVAQLNYPEVLRFARSAVHFADEAYYDPTMVPQLYFPPEHLIAIFVPLLLPLCMPLFAGVKREVQRLKRKQK